MLLEDGAHQQGEVSHLGGREKWRCDVDGEQDAIVPWQRRNLLRRMVVWQLHLMPGTFLFLEPCWWVCVRRRSLLDSEW
jgi:hypothetical protein